jgi:hypothetical protein
MTSRPGSISRGALAAIVTAVACLAAPVAGAAAAETTIDSGPSGPTSDSTPQFTFSSPDPLATFECRDHPAGGPEGAFRGCSSPWTVGESAEYALPLPDGDYVFEVRAVDATGPGSPARRAFTVDTVPPQTEITGGPGDTTDTTAVFLFSAPGGVGFSCRLDGGAWEPCGSPQTYRGLSLGPHRFDVRAFDAAGNLDPTPAEHAWQVLRPGLVIPGTVQLATALARELVQLRRALAKIRLRRLARRRIVVFRTFDALTAGTVQIRVRSRVRQGQGQGQRQGQGRRWIRLLAGKRDVPAAGRHRVRAKVTKKGRRLARRRRKLPVELRLSFKDLAGRSLWATAKLTLKR